MYRLILSAVTFGLILGLNTPSIAQNQSDYQVYKSFTATYEQLEQRLERAGDPEEADSLLSRISELENQYASRAAMLDEALHPREFRPMINRLRQQTRDVRSKLSRIRSLTNEVGQLHAQVNAYHNQVAHMSSQTDSLQKTIRASAVQNRELNQLSDRLRERVRARDSLIASVIDSLMITYDHLPAQSREEIRTTTDTRLPNQADALDLVEQIATGNADFLAGSAQLNTVDYLRMRSVYREFRKMWSRLDDDLLELYGAGENRGETIEEAMTQWRSRLDTQMWMAVNREFQTHNFPIGEVSSGEELFEEVNRFLSDEIERAEESSSDSMRQRYRRFNQFWNNEVQSRWAEYAGEEFLTHKQMAAVNRDLDTWAGRVQSPDSNLFAYLFGASMFLWLLTGLLFVRKSRS